jgi:hypothetical protein
MGIGVFWAGADADANGDSAPGYNIMAQHSITTRAVTAVFKPWNALTLSAGPAAYRRLSFFESGNVLGRQAESRDTAWGLTVGAKGAIEHSPGVFSEYLAQYQFAGSMKLPAAEIAFTRTGQTARWPRSSIPFSHWILGMGIGMRF